MTKTVIPPVEFEPEFIAGEKTIYEEKIVFNHVLGLKVVSLAPERVVARIDMKPELVGHYAYNRIHGGVISAGLDAMGGLACSSTAGSSRPTLDAAGRWRRPRCRRGQRALHRDALRDVIAASSGIGKKR